MTGARVLDEAKTDVYGSAKRADGTLAAGTVLGRYIVVERIGTGGLGDVYAAYDPELDRKIAIKLLKPEATEAGVEGMGDPTTRLLREAQAMAKLNHENVVTVYDVGTFAGQVFIAMEFIRGETLTRWVAAKSRTWSEIRDVFVAAGEGLAAAHAVGLVHRDFKPANVLVSDKGEVTVLDFGLARIVDAQVPISDDRVSSPPVRGVPKPMSLLDHAVTDVGLVLGTPPFMAAELFEGAPGSARSDQFAFCVSLYKALHGIRPYPAQTVDDHIEAVRKGEPVLERRNKSVPIWLHRAALRGVRKDPAQRYTSMDALLAAMQTDRRRRKRWFLAAVIGVPLLSMGAVGASFAMRPEATAAEIDETKEVVAQARAAAAKGYYVYPPADDPEHDTAYAKVLELEGMQGAIAEPAQEAADELRDEMASTLVRLGDEYYERPGGEPFAVDFYAAALVFDPQRSRARERVTLTPGELAALRDRAQTRDFSEAELVAAEALSALAEPDEQAREEKVVGVATKPRRATSTTARLEALLGKRREDVVSKLGASSGGAPDVPRLGTAPLEDTPVAVAVDGDGDETGGDAPPVDDGEALVPSTPAPLDTEATTRDPKAAKEAATAGKALLAKGDLGAAEAKFHQALRYDRRHVAALLGLARVHFHRRDFDKMADYAQRATKAAPRSGAAHTLLGDAYFKLLRYDDAKQAYARAVGLGDKTAQKGLARVEAKLGG